MPLSKKAQQIKDATEGSGEGVEALTGRRDTGGSKLPTRLSGDSEYTNADLDKLYDNLEKGWEGTTADTTEGTLPYGGLLGNVRIRRVVVSNNDTTNQETPNT